MLGLALLAAAVPLAAAFTVVPEQSVSGPFTSYDAEGFRSYPGWRVGGSTSLQENFVRLTNDRASKRASLWSTTRMGMDDWSTTIRFRVSGQGKRLFGDGLAFVRGRGARARGPTAALHWHPPSHPAQCCSSPLPPSLPLPHPHPSLSPAPLRPSPPLPTLRGAVVHCQRDAQGRQPARLPGHVSRLWRDL